MARLWKNADGTREGKYLVQRRDGTVPEWPYFVLGAKDPAAEAALIAYAKAALECGMDVDYVDDIIDLSSEFGRYAEEHFEGDPDAPRHRQDDPETIAKMRQAKGS